MTTRTRFNAGAGDAPKPKTHQQQQQPPSSELLALMTMEFPADDGPPQMEDHFAGIVVGGGGPHDDDEYVNEDEGFDLADIVRSEQPPQSSSRHHESDKKKAHAVAEAFGGVGGGDDNDAFKLTDYSGILDAPEKGVLAFPPRVDPATGLQPESLFVQGTELGESRWVTWTEDKGAYNDGDDDDAVDHLGRGRDERYTNLMFRGAMRSAIDIQHADADLKEHHHSLERMLNQHRDQQQREKQEQQDQASSSSSSTKKDRGVAGDQLWVSRYSPTRFSELLSDERVNLEILQWMTAWKKHLMAAAGAKAESAAGGGSGSSGSKVHAARLQQNPRPESTIALLAGPAGVGKTTLAHVIAKHCGFDAIEVNASYSRSAKDMKELIETATADTGTTTAKYFESLAEFGGNTSSNSAGGGNSASFFTAAGLEATLLRPKCLILDECDGSTADVVRCLLTTPLHRPVICLANNLYAPVLRDLRSTPSSAIFTRQVPPLLPQRIVSRLEAIAETERIQIDRHSLMDLALHCQGDIRQCLNTLFFVSRQVPAAGNTSSNNSRAAALAGSSSSSAAGRVLKMMRVREPLTSMWTMWEACLERREKDKYVQALIASGAMSKEEATRAANSALVRPPVAFTSVSGSSAGSSCIGGAGGEELASAFATSATAKQKLDVGAQWVARCASKCPDIETVVAGLHEWYCQLNYPDYSFRSTAVVCDAFAWADRSDPFTSHFSAICESVAGIVFRACATLQQRPPQLRNVMPREAANWYSEGQRFAETVAAFVETVTHPVYVTAPGAGHGDAASSQPIATVVRSWCGAQAAALDVLPFFVHLVSLMPAGLKLAPGVTQLQNVRNLRDAEALQRLVELMATFGITFEHDAAKAAINESRAKNNSNPHQGGGGGFHQQQQNQRREEVEWKMRPDFEQWTDFKRSSEVLAREQMGLRSRKVYGTGDSRAATAAANNSSGSGNPYGRKDHNIVPEMAISRAAAGLHGASGSNHLAQLLLKRSVFDVNMRPLTNDVRSLLVGEVTQARISGARRPRTTTTTTAAAAATTSAAQNKNAINVDLVDDAPLSSSAAAAKPEVKHEHQDGPHAPPNSASAAATTKTISGAPIKKDFFGRPIVKKEANADDHGKAGHRTAKEEAAVPAVKYRFFDGSTNSVKKPAVLADFI